MRKSPLRPFDVWFKNGKGMFGSGLVVVMARNKREAAKKFYKNIGFECEIEIMGESLPPTS